MAFLVAILAAISVFQVSVGTMALVLAWSAPALLDKQFLQRFLTGRRLAPTRSNRTLVAIWSILFGIYLLLSMGDERVISYFVFAAWVPFGFVLLMRSLPSRIE